MTRTISRWPTTWHFQTAEQPMEQPLEPDGHGDGDAPDRARWVLALGIVALFIGPLGIFAWMAGNACLKSIADGRMDPTSESNAKAGRLLGMIALCLFAFKVTVLFPLFAIFYWWA